MINEYKAEVSIQVDLTIHAESKALAEELIDQYVDSVNPSGQSREVYSRGRGIKVYVNRAYDTGWFMWRDSERFGNEAYRAECKIRQQNALTEFTDSCAESFDDFIAEDRRRTAARKERQ